MAKIADQAAGRAGPMVIPIALLRSMRPRQWFKNVFVFAAIAFSDDRLWMHFDRLLQVIGAFIVFCACSSAIYLINDLVDIEKDRAHPRKRNRPLASGILPPAVALVAAVLLIAFTVVAAYLLDSGDGVADYGLVVIMATYVVVQGILYSFWLKHIVILDIFTIAAGFVLRAVAGAVVLDIRITPWLLVCMGLLSLFLGLGKRRAELVLLGDDATSHRRILQEYSLPMLDQLISMVTAATIIAYTLFTYNSVTLQRYPYPAMMITVPFVVYAIFRYIYLIHQRGGGGSPEELVMKDMPLALSIALYGMTVLLLTALVPRT
jgi:4-hydroxybenzoate polyprenyltransferase